MRHMKVAAITYPPWTFVYDEDDEKKIYGYVGAALTNITASMNMTTEIVAPLDGYYGGVTENGTMVGSLMMIDKGLVDVVAGPFALEYLFWKEFPSTNQLFTDYIKIMSGMRDPFVSDPGAFINMFDRTTWILFITSYIVLITMSTIAYRVAGRKGRQTNIFTDVSKYLYAYIEVLFFEATQVRFVPLANRVLLGAWLIACFVLVNLFNGEVKANLLVKSETTRINSADDLQRHRDMLPMIAESSPMLYVIRVIKPYIFLRHLTLIPVHANNVGFCCFICSLRRKLLLPDKTRELIIGIPRRRNQCE
ncbi:uncharacterized protein LOC142814150 [Rhipicephalus microplus]|uniref:uncharacterized protein LOC142814150 n=1 Tax=Rhipicephalus microplus TaxID=6941 RepID=UPI003F6AF2FF